MKFRLHHVGVLVGNISAAESEYTKRFGYQKKSESIHDPLQTAFVQFLKLNEEPAFLELISPDGPGSKLSNALKKGGGLNHFCYVVKDIAAACKELGDSGMFLLQKPVDAVAFPGRKIAWLMGRDGIAVELVEEGNDHWEVNNEHLAKA